MSCLVVEPAGLVTTPDGNGATFGSDGTTSASRSSICLKRQVVLINSKGNYKGTHQSGSSSRRISGGKHRNEDDKDGEDGAHAEKDTG